jgi:signal transduction histidine kinase/CheY-like chemotaxis protein
MNPSPPPSHPQQSGLPRPRRRGLATRLAWAFASLAGALLLIVGLVLTLFSYNTQLEQIVLRQERTAGEAAQIASSYLSQARDTLLAFGQVGSVQSILFRSMAIQQQQLHAILASYPDLFQELAVVDAEGDELARVSPAHDYGLDELRSWAGQPAFQQAIRGDVYVADQTRLRAGSGIPSVVVAVPIVGAASRGALIADVSIEGMWNAVARVDVGQTGYAYIVDRNTGSIIAHSEPARYLQYEGQSLDHVPIVRQIMAGQIMAGQTVTHQYPGLQGAPVVGADALVPGTGWSLVVELPTQEALAGLRNSLYLLAALIVAGVLAAASLGLVVPRRAVRPLLALQEGARQIGAGRLDHTIDVHTGDEIEDLARSFNQMAASLQASRAQLESRVEERTAELAAASRRDRRRAVQLEASADVAHAITSIQDQDKLLPQVTQLISERFGWYHVGIFLLDDAGQFAVLRAANSPGGQRMLSRRHRLRVGAQGIVGRVTATGEPRIALDVGADAIYFDNPDLPATRSEMALPLRVGERIIGALDVQSTSAAAYDDEDVALLTSLADQVAIAISNALLFQETQKALDDVQRVQRQYVQREWAAVTGRQPDLSYEYRSPGIAPSGIAEPQLGPSPISRSSPPSPSSFPRRRESTATDLAAPIKLRDEVIGELDLQIPGAPHRWTDDEIAIVEAITDQVAQALENARLLEAEQQLARETSRRAEQLATLHRMGLAITSALSLRDVLEALYERIHQVMDAASFYVALYDPATGALEFPLLVEDGRRVELEPRNIGQEPGITGHVIRTQQPLYVPDTGAIPDDAPYRSVFVADQKPRSFLGVPLVFRGEVFGVLSVQSHQANAYAPADAELLATIATQASIAIQNARAYERLVDTADELREIDRLKTQFLANMSHELRTPLNSIIGFSRVMLKGIDGPLTDLQQTDLTSIYNSGQHLLSLINSILDMSKIEAGKIELAFEEVDLASIFRVVLSTTRALVKDRPVQLRSEIPDSLPTVWSDAQRVRQILINLLSNASKFTTAGSITLRAQAGDEFVTISVADTGVGIDAEAQRRLFIPFQQVDGSTTRRAEGTGLGLAISRSFVEILGGEIWVESEPGEGSTFFFTLPVYQAVRQREEQEVGVSLQPGKKVIMAVDDDAGVISLLQRYLENDGYQVVGVTQAPSALDTARRLAPHLSAITLDIVMPNVDGWQILRALKQDAGTSDIPIILCSIVDSLDQGLALGASACLRKPVTRDQLLQTLRKLDGH